MKEIEVFSVMGRWIVYFTSIQSALGEERDLSQSIRGWIEPLINPGVNVNGLNEDRSVNGKKAAEAFGWNTV